MTDTQPDFRLLWAKSSPRHPLWKHLLDVAAVCFELPIPLALEEWRREELSLIAGLHDAGKADSSFQHQDQRLSDELQQHGFPRFPLPPCRHERISGEFIQRRLEQWGVPAAVTRALHMAVAAHHGSFDLPARPVAPVYAEAQDALLKLLQETIGVPRVPDRIPADLSAFGMALSGRIVLSDWLASNEQYFTASDLGGTDDPARYWAASRRVAATWIRRLGLGESVRHGNPSGIVSVPRPIQQCLLDHDIPPSLVIIEAPMGEGKTEAAWIIAEKWKQHGYVGTYMALPTMATSDGLHARYRDEYLGRVEPDATVALVHGMAWLRDDLESSAPVGIGEHDEGRELAAAWFRPTRRAMLASHGVGTVDQALLAGMSVKFGFLRLYGLSRRVLIIDEAHAYDAYMSTIMERLLQWCSCLRIPVVILSATLSSAQRIRLIHAYGGTTDPLQTDLPYPLITAVQQTGPPITFATQASSHRELHLHTHAILTAEARQTADLAVSLVADGGCCCVITNTVRRAQEVFDALGDHTGLERMLFHARFTVRDRQQLTTAVIERFGKDRSTRPSRCVLVATQVVEQSLDVDFDAMISEIAPVDLLLQRSGRLHRHRSRSTPPCLHVLVPMSFNEHGEPDFGGSGYVYARKPLLRTLILLSRHRCIQLPAQFREVIEACYGSEHMEDEAVPWSTIQRADEEWDQSIRELEQTARRFSLGIPRSGSFHVGTNTPMGDDSDDGSGWRGATRLGAQDITALLLPASDIDRVSDGTISFEEVRALYAHAVKIPPYLPYRTPAPGFQPGMMGKARLSGVVLLPLAPDGWSGTDRHGHTFELTYCTTRGLTIRRI